MRTRAFAAPVRVTVPSSTVHAHRLGYKGHIYTPCSRTNFDTFYCQRVNSGNLLSWRSQRRKKQEHLGLLCSRMTEPVSTPAGPRPFVLGLTGSIGMGKSTVSDMFRKHSIPVLDADKLVHELYGPGGEAVEPVGKLFPGVVVDGAVSRPELAKHVINQEANMKKLEAIVHPLVAAQRDVFLRQSVKDRHRLIVMDIPLLFETSAEKGVDAVLVVSTANLELQKQRVCARPGMTEEKFAAILSRQVPDDEKRKRADFVLDTSCAVDETEAKLVAIIHTILCRPAPTLPFPQ
mmetsp:Transcript_27101/g.51241  ORF Transcript_27101/g.51241 Transcript_27101/m.51241 type:complete len:291 (-) Transcript_27101:239-1111(-)